VPRIPPLPRLPFISDPLRRARVPDDLPSVTSRAEEVDPAEAGMDPEAVERIWAGAERLYRSGMHPAIGLCIRRNGHVFLDRSIGHARGNGPDDPADGDKVLNTPDTPYVIYSASKAITAMMAHLLDQKGLIHIGDRVCEYIPEYARHGKEAITIAHVLAHKAGVPNLPGEAFDLDHVGDDEFILELLCDAKPASRPGKTLAYHAVSGGFIVAEIVKRTTGKTIREFLAEEVLDPLGFRWGNYGVSATDLDKVGTSYVTGPPALPPLSTALKRALGVSTNEVVEKSNDPRFLTGIVPAANVVTTANELSLFFELMRAGGELNGVRVFEPRTLRRAVTEQSFRELDFTLGFPQRYSLGLMLGAKRVTLWGPDTELAFGHLGYTNVLGWADPERGISAALLTSGKPLLYAEIYDLWNLTRKIGAECPKEPRSELKFAPVAAASEE
jgi:CubicO group peptidase (beta-lactamase class C family)